MPEQGFDVLAHFGQDHFLDRFQRYKAHIAEWRQQYPRLASVDLRYSQQVVLQMAAGSITEQPALTADSDKEPESGKHAPREGTTQAATFSASNLDVSSAQMEPNAASVAAQTPKRTAARAKQERINELAARMRAKRAAARRAALKREKQKSSNRPHSTASEGQDQ
jgi:cell division protein FtsQ